MRTFTKILVGFIVCSAMASCKKENSIPANANSSSDEIRSAPPGGNYWLTRKDFPFGIVRATSFEINGKGYVVGGRSGTPTTEVWEFDPTLNNWTQKTNLPSPGKRVNAASFVIDGKGYIVGGRIIPSDPDDWYLTHETWEYNPATDTWRQRRNLTIARETATGFAINGKGYIAMGSTGTFSYRDDVLEYDPELNTWITKSRLFVPGQDMSRYLPVSFVLNKKAYIGTGHTHSSLEQQDFWEFDPQTNAWVRKADMPEGRRQGAIAFTIGGLGYVGTGYYIGTGERKDFWSYNRSTNSWTRKADVPGYGRQSAIGFSIGSQGYVGMGSMYVRYPENLEDFNTKFYRYSISTTGSTQTQ